MKLLSIIIQRIKRMIGTGADAGYHLWNLFIFALTVVILILCGVAYLGRWLRSLGLIG